MGTRDIILIAVLGASLPVCFFRPFYGILVWTVIGIVNPQNFTFGFAASFPWAQAVAIPTIAGALFFGRGWRQLRSREVFLLLALWLWFTVTSLISEHTPLFIDHTADTWIRWAFVSKILLMTVVSVAVVDSMAKLRMLVLVIAACLGVFVLKDLPFMIATRGAFRLYGPPQSMIADNNDFGLALNMALPLFFFLGQTEANRRMRALMYFLTLATVPAIFFTYSRGALVGLFAVGAILFWRMKQRLVLVPVIALALLAGLFFTPESWQERMAGFMSGKVDASALSRFNAWTFSWNLTMDYPLTGGGFDTFTPELFQRYAPTVTDVHGPHSVYFGVLAEHGFPGLFLYLLLVLSCLVSTRRVIKAARLRQDQRAVDYANMFAASLIGFLTSGLFLGRAYFDLYFTIVACIAILSHVLRAEWARQAAAEDYQQEQSDLPLEVPILAEENS
jgi:putative inorganic carbon (HCO3(-)) transporter